MAVVSIATLKGYFETGDFPTQTQFENLIDTLENSSTSIYQRYVALLSQSGTNAPTAIVLENTLGGTITFAYVTVGIYTATLTGAFTASKTAILVSEFGRAAVKITRTDANSLGIRTDGLSAGAWASADSSITDTFVEIRVYP